MEILKLLITVVYPVSGIISFLGYWPTIMDLSHHAKKTVNLRTFFMWELTLFISFLYASVVLGDPIYSAMVLIRLGACTTVITMSYRHYLRNQKSARGPDASQLSFDL